MIIIASFHSFPTAVIVVDPNSNENLVTNEGKVWLRVLYLAKQAKIQFKQTVLPSPLLHLIHL